MANIKSMKKDIKRNAKRRATNLAVRSGLKTFIKKVRQSAGKDEATVKGAVATAVSALDKASQNGVIHPNQAARRKSRLMKAANKAKAEPAPSKASGKKSS